MFAVILSRSPSHRRGSTVSSLVARGMMVREIQDHLAEFFAELNRGDGPIGIQLDRCADRIQVFDAVAIQLCYGLPDPMMLSQ
jgi:hypothetical protein